MAFLLRKSKTRTYAKHVCNYIMCADKHGFFCTKKNKRTYMCFALNIIVGGDILKTYYEHGDSLLITSTSRILEIGLGLRGGV